MLTKVKLKSVEKNEIFSGKDTEKVVLNYLDPRARCHRFVQNLTES